MIFGKRLKEYFDKKREHEEFLKNYERQKEKLERTQKELDTLSDKTLTELARLKVTEERLFEAQKEAELKLKVAQSNATPESIFKDCLKIAFEICWDLNRKNTLEIIERVKFEESEKERLRYDKAVEIFLKKFDYIEGIMDTKSIAKVYENLKNDKLIAERQGHKVNLATTLNRLNVLKELEIIK